MPLEQEIITRRVLTYAKSWFDCTVCDRHTIQDEKTTFYRSNWNLTDLSLVHERRIIGSDEFLNVKSKHQLSIDSQININDRFQSIDLLQFKRCALHGVLCLWAFNAGFGFFSASFLSFITPWTLNKIPFMFIAMFEFIKNHFETSEWPLDVNTAAYLYTYRIRN